MPRPTHRPAGGKFGASKSLRQRNKLEKLQRIQTAARTLFVSKGYDEATMREIARLADVGLGTLFRFWAYRRFVFTAEPGFTQELGVDPHGRLNTGELRIITD